MISCYCESMYPTSKLLYLNHWLCPKSLPYCFTKACIAFSFLLIVCIYVHSNIGKTDSPNLRSFTQQFPGVIVEHEGGSVMADVRQMLLCFEYLPRGSLDKYITGKVIWHVSCVSAPTLNFFFMLFIID